MKYAYTNGVILDGTADMKPLTGHTVLTDGECITAIVPDGGDLSDYEVIDLGGKTLLPGLVNMHLHLPAGGRPSKKQKDTVKLVRIMTSNRLMRAVTKKVCAGYARTQLYSGVTTIRTMDGILDIDSRIRDDIASGKLTGPRILAANMAVSVPGGHMAGSLAHIASTPEEAAGFTAQVARENPDVIKLMVTGGVLDAKVKGEPGEVKMSGELIAAACKEAHSHGLKVAAHVESPEGVRLALQNGVDTIEHGAKPDEEILRLFRERGACLIATLSPALPFALFDRSVSGVSETEQYNGSVVFEGIIQCAKACLAAGIPVGLGTDTGCPFITHYDMWREICYFVKYCGVTPSFALHTATQVNARLAGLGDVTGTVTPGKCADFLVVEGDPLSDLSVLRSPAMVVAKGRPIRHPKVKKMKQVEDILDRYL